jgi:hypothetical protein
MTRFKLSQSPVNALSVSNFESEDHSSLNFIRRKREKERIERENLKFAEKLITTESNLNKHKFLSEYKQIQTYKKMIGRSNRKDKVSKKIRFPPVKRNLIKHFGSSNSIDISDNTIEAEIYLGNRNEHANMSMIDDQSKLINISTSDQSGQPKIVLKLSKQIKTSPKASKKGLFNYYNQGDSVKKKKKIIKKHDKSKNGGSTQVGKCIDGINGIEEIREVKKLTDIEAVSSFKAQEPSTINNKKQSNVDATQLASDQGTLRHHSSSYIDNEYF